MKRLITIVAFLMLSAPFTTLAQQQPPPDKPLTLTVTQSDLDLIMRLIQLEKIRRQQPYAEIDPLLQKLGDQFMAQQPKTEAPPVTAVPAK